MSDTNKTSLKINFNFSDLEIVDISRKNLNTTVNYNSTNKKKWELFDGSERKSIFHTLKNVFDCNTNVLFLPKNLQIEYELKIISTLNENFTENQGLLAFITSGSSGHPKVVVHTINSLLRAAQKIVDAYPLVKSGIFYHLFPVTYMAGVLNSILVPYVAGGRLIFDNEFSFSSPFSLVEKFNKHKPNILWLSPGMLSTIDVFKTRFKNKGYKIELILNATGPLDTSTRNSIRENLETEVFSTYGTSELLFISGERVASKVVSIGTPFENVRISLENFGTDKIPKNVKEISVSTDTKPHAVFKFSKLLQQYEWDTDFKKEFVLTKDIAILDDNMIQIIGRSDELVVLGGINISLSKIEEIVNSIPGVVESCARAQFGGTFASLELLYEPNPIFSSMGENIMVQKLSVLGIESIPRKFTKVRFSRTHSGKINKFEIRNSNTGYTVL